MGWGRKVAHIIRKADRRYIITLGVCGLIVLLSSLRAQKMSEERVRGIVENTVFNALVCKNFAVVSDDGLANPAVVILGENGGTISVGDMDNISVTITKEAIGFSEKRKPVTALFIGRLVFADYDGTNIVLDKATINSIHD